MKKTIWKYKLKIEAFQTLKIPFSAEILTVRMQNNIPCIWVLANPDSPKVEWSIEMYGTGSDIIYSKDAYRKYLGTCQLEGLALHIFKFTGYKKTANHEKDIRFNQLR